MEVLKRMPVKTYNVKANVGAAEPQVKEAWNGKNDEFRSLKLREQIARSYLQGKSQTAIGLEVGKDPTTVLYHLKKIREEWLATIVESYDEVKARELAKIDNLEARAWESFEKSCEDAVTRQTEVEKARRATKEGEESVTDNEFIVTGKTHKKTSRGQAGDPRFLERIAWCIDYRCKIFGIHKENPTNVNTLIFNFDQLYGKPPDLEDDPIERRIAAVSNPPAPPFSKGAPGAVPKPKKGKF